MTDAGPDGGAGTPPEPGERLSGTARTEAFSDAVFAIAITLLVLEVRVPTPAQVAEHGGLLPALLHAWPAYVGYLISFATVSVFWLNHHAVFAKIARIDRSLQWSNLLLLLVVAFMPFPNALIIEYLAGDPFSEPARTATAVYASVFALSTVPWLLIWTHLASSPALLRPPFDSAYARRERRRSWVGVLAYWPGIAVAYAAPIVAILLFLGAALFYGFTAQGVAPRRREPVDRSV